MKHVCDHIHPSILTFLAKRAGSRGGGGVASRSMDGWWILWMDLLCSVDFLSFDGFAFLDGSTLLISS